jgi:hypothetical protein
MKTVSFGALVICYVVMAGGRSGAEDRVKTEELASLLEQAKTHYKTNQSDLAQRTFQKVVRIAGPEKDQQLLKGDALWFHRRLAKAVSPQELAEGMETWVGAGLTRKDAQTRAEARIEEFKDMNSYRKLFIQGNAPDQVAERERAAQLEQERVAEQERVEKAKAEQARQQEQAERAKAERARQEALAEKAKADAVARQEREVRLAQEAEQLRKDRARAELAERKARAEEEERAAAARANAELQRRRALAEHEEELTAARHAAAVTLAAVVGSIIAYLIFVVLLSVWVIRDCRNRSVENGLFWMLLILPLNLFALLIYMASRPHGTLIRCEACGNPRLPYVGVCPHCRHVVRARSMTPDVANLL